MTDPTPDFSPEAIAEAALLDETRAWFDVHRAHFVPEIQIRFMSLLTAGESLLAALEASERENERLRAVVEAVKAWSYYALAEVVTVATCECGAQLMADTEAGALALLTAHIDEAGPC